MTFARAITFCINILVVAAGADELITTRVLYWNQKLRFERVVFEKIPEVSEKKKVQKLKNLNFLRAINFSDKKSGQRCLCKGTSHIPFYSLSPKFLIWTVKKNENLSCSRVKTFCVKNFERNLLCNKTSQNLIYPLNLKSQNWECSYRANQSFKKQSKIRKLDFSWSQIFLCLKVWT